MVGPGASINLDNKTRRTVLAVGVGGGCLDFFLSPIIYLFLSPSLW